MVTTAAVIAVTRFGFGEPPEKLAEIGNNHRDWLLAQLQSAPLPPEVANTPLSAQLLQKSMKLRKARRDAKKNQDTAKPDTGKQLRHYYMEQAAGRTRAAIHSDAPFRELIQLDQSWNPLQQKLKTPNGLVISTYRSLGLPTGNDRHLPGALSELGQPPAAPAPPPAGLSRVFTGMAAPC